MIIINLTKNVLMFEHKPGTEYLGASDFEVRAGAKIKIMDVSTTDVRMPNGALCEKQVARFQTADGMDYYLLVEELAEADRAALTSAQQ